MKPKHFAEFYHIRNGSYVAAVGSDGVAYMDGRWNMASMRAHADKIAKQRKFAGYRIARGTHTNPFYLTAAVIPVQS